MKKKFIEYKSKILKKVEEHPEAAYYTVLAGGLVGIVAVGLGANKIYDKQITGGTKHVYSYGKESPLKFKISDKHAKLYNSAVAEFMAAQRRYSEIHGVPWNSNAPLELRATDKEIRAFNAFKPIFDKALKNLGRDIPASEILDDYLVKN